jgi:catechol 2,3-dioxygenase-like lactoylglutathione lyase family enzyme
MSTSPSSSASPGIAPIAWAAHMTAALGVSDIDRSIAWYRDVLGFELIYKLDDWGWAELRSPIAHVSVGIGQTEDLEPRGGATLTFGVVDSPLPGPRSRRAASGSTARRPRSPGWCGSRPSMTRTGTPSCSRSSSTCRTPAAGDGPRYLTTR